MVATLMAVVPAILIVILMYCMLQNINHSNYHIMNKKLRFIFIIAMIISIMAISGSVFAQTSAFPENAFVETEQIAASSSDYRKIDESGDGLVEPQASQNYSVQSQKNNQQNNSLSRNTTSVFSFII